MFKNNSWKYKKFLYLHIINQYCKAYVMYIYEYRWTFTLIIRFEMCSQAY